MKTMNKVIAAMMLMAITTAMAGKTTVSTSRQNHNNGKNDKVVVVNNHKGDSHFDRNEKTLPHLNAHKKNAYHPDMKTCTIILSRHDYQKNVRARSREHEGRDGYQVESAYS